MPGKWAYIGGGTVLLAIGIVAARSNLPTRLRGQDVPPPVTAAPVATTQVTATPVTGTPAVTETSPTAFAASPEPDPELARLAAELTARETENAELRTTLAVRDTVLQSLQADLAERETTIGELEARIVASDAEIASLRAELATLVQARSFEAKAALFEPGGDASATRVEAVRADTPPLASILDAGGTPAATLLALPDTARTVEVHFDFASARLTPGGQANAAAAAVTLADMPLAAVRVIGHTDTVGSPAANRRLAGKRARSVADALVAAGLSPDLIEIDDMGEADPPVPTGDGVPEPLNRTVAIVPVPLPIS